MTLRELLESGIVIEGYRKIQCWESEANPTIYHEGYDQGDLEKYLDREVAYTFPYNPTSNEAKSLFYLLILLHSYSSDHRIFHINLFFFHKRFLYLK